MDTLDAQELARGLSSVALRRDDPAVQKVAAVTAPLRKQADMQQFLNNPQLQSTLNNPYLQNALLGVGAGGLIGALQGKKKRRAILDYALMGIGGLGATAAKNMLLTKTAPPPSIAAAKQDGRTGSALMNLAGAGAGAYGGHQAANALDSYGKLERFLESGDPTAKSLKSTVETLRANSGPSRVTKNLTQHVRKLPEAIHDPSLTQQMLRTIRRLRGPDHVPRDVNLALEAAGMTTPASIASRVNTATGAARGRFFGGITGRGADDVSNVLAAIASEPKAFGGTGGKATVRLTGRQLQKAMRSMPRVGGRWAGIGLPVLGALGVPALMNSFGGDSAGE